MQVTVHEYELLIHEAHLDTFGHVNNAKYLEVLEEARWDFITRNGYGLDEVVRTRIGPTILEINLRFQREIKNRQRVRSAAGLIRTGGRSPSSCSRSWTRTATSAARRCSPSACST